MNNIVIIIVIEGNCKAIPPGQKTFIRRFLKDKDCNSYQIIGVLPKETFKAIFTNIDIMHPSDVLTILSSTLYH